MTPNKSDSGELDVLRDLLYDTAYATGADSETGERTYAFVEGELLEALTIHIQAVGEEIIGENEGDLPKGILKNYWSYPSIRNRLKDEQRKRLAQYLGRES